MRKYLLLLTILFIAFNSYGSKASKFFHKMHEQAKAQEQKERQQDMNFADYAFVLDRRYNDDQGQLCRDYLVRSRSNPFRQGHYVICDRR